METSQESEESTADARSRIRSPFTRDKHNEHDGNSSSSNNHHHDKTPQQHQQPQDSPTAVPEDDWLVACRCESARAVSTLLSCLQHICSGDKRGDTTMSNGAAISRRYSQASSSGAARGRSTVVQPVTVFCSKSSLTFHVYGQAKQSQASVDLQKDMFSHYQVVQHQPSQQQQQQPNSNNNDATSQHTEDWEAGGEFCVNLTTVLECLNVLGGDHTKITADRTSLCFSYNISDEILKLELLEEDTGVLMTAAIPGLMPNDDVDDDAGTSLAHTFRSSPLVARMIVQSAMLREVLPELELVAGATCATIALGENGLEIAAIGHLGDGWVHVPAQGSHVIALEVVDPKDDDQDNGRRKSNNNMRARTYPLHSLLSSMRGLDIAMETCISMNANGMMAMQHQVMDPMGKEVANFVDFIMTCLEDEEDEENDSTQASQSQAPSPSQASTANGSWRNWNRAATKQQHKQQARKKQAKARKNTKKGADQETPQRHKPRTRERPQRKQSDSECDDDNQQDVNGVELSSDVEEDNDSPRQRQRRQRLSARNSDNESSPDHRRDEQERDDGNDDSDSDNDPQVAAVSAAPLFGTVVREGRRSSSPSRRRSVRQRRSISRNSRARSNQEEDAAAEGNSNGDESAASRNMLADTDEEQGQSEDEPLDVTALGPSPPRRRNRSGVCDSPELVYGKQA